MGPTAQVMVVQVVEISSLWVIFIEIRPYYMCPDWDNWITLNYPNLSHTHFSQEIQVTTSEQHHYLSITSKYTIVWFQQLRLW